MVLGNERLYGLQWEAVCSVADKLGPSAESVRIQVRRAEIGVFEAASALFGAELDRQWSS